MNQQFKNDLTKLLNTYNVDSVCNTPDFVLAEYLVNVLNSLAVANVQRGLFENSEVEIHVDGVKDAN